MIDDISSGSTLYAQRRAPTPVNCHRRSRFGLAWLVGCLCLAAWIQFRPAVQPTVRGVATTAAAVPVPQPKEILVRKKIEDLQVGERIPGRNPLREQVDLFEPAEADWLKISLRMRQQNGLWLWIDLLRPTEWGQANEVGAGRTIYLDLPEMGAVGDAQVMGIGPCPAIEQGPGTVITGTFKRESDGSHVVELRLQGQEEPTGVTDNHPYWSVDRQEFVEVGNLRVGELVDTEFGSRHIESVRPCFYRGFLYNLETSEHVFRVGSLGTLVHNSCATKLRNAMNAAGVYGDAGTVPHHLVSRFANNADAIRARAVLSRPDINIGLDSHWNGVFLPSSRYASQARGLIHEGVHSMDYYAAVAERLERAAQNGRAGVLRELQKLRNELLGGIAPAP